MNEADILRMARQSTFDAPIHHDMAMLERFARLVAAQEREACAVIADEWSQGEHPEIAERIRVRNDL